MLVRFGTESLGPQWPACVLCIGTFDGVHLGHQEVIRRAVRRSAEIERPPVVLTFDRHPLATLAPERCPPAVGTLDIDLDEFRSLGVCAAVVLPFDERLANTSAETFFTEVLQSSLRGEEVVVGHDFAFGKGRVGTPEWLRERIPTTIVPSFQVEGHRVSSSEIRELIRRGELEHAGRLLGRSWALEGIVVGGQRLGRTLGYPTVNLATAGRQVQPPHGIYAGRALTKMGEFKAAISVGVRPTVGDSPRTIEAYLLDYPGTDLYGSAIRLGFERRLRDEMKFDSLEALQAQMALDVAEVARKEYESL